MGCQPKQLLRVLTKLYCLFELLGVSIRCSDTTFVLSNRDSLVCSNCRHWLACDCLYFLQTNKMTDKTDIQTELPLEDTIWIVTVETKHGTDVILLRQDEVPCDADLKRIEDQFKHDYDLEEVWASTESGYREISKLPCNVEEYLAT